MERRTFLSLPLAGMAVASGSVGAFTAEFEKFSRAAYGQDWRLVVPYYWTSTPVGEVAAARKNAP